MQAIVTSALLRYERGKITWAQYLAVLKWAIDF